MIQDFLGIEKCYYPLLKGEYFIIDDIVNNKSPFIGINGRWTLRLKNNLNKIVHFYQNDGCLMTQNNLKKCDWVCFDERSFYFVEAKDVKIKNRKQERNDAVEKFKNTIQYFFDRCPQIKELNLFVVVNFKSNSNLARTSNQAKEYIFSENFGAKYLETNYIEF